MLLKLYRMKSGKICQACLHFGVCTSSLRGRTIVRFSNQEAKRYFEAIYSGSLGQQIYSRRKQKIELIFGYLKRVLI